MKKVYTNSHRIGRFRFATPRLPAFMSKSYGRILFVTACALVLLFSISCVLAIAGSSLNEAVARSETRIEAPAGEKAAPPGLYAQYAILIDGESGRVLFEKNAHEQVPVASTTKIMTALVARGQLDLDEKITIAPESADVGEQGIGVVPGEVLTAEELLWALLVYSANDAAHALAQYTTGSIPSFVELMNSRAAALGARETNFENPHGLDTPGHYSSAYDLAIMSRELMKDPVLAKMVGSASHNISGPPGQPERILENLNDLVGDYEGANGIKTGYTSKAGWCLAASAARGDKWLVGVVLNSPTKMARNVDAANMFDYGFSSTERIVLAGEDQKLGTTRVSAFPRRYVSVVPAREVAALTLRGSGDVFDVRVAVVRKAGGGVKKGDDLGTVEALLNGQRIERVQAEAARRAGAPGPFTAVFAFLWYSLCWMGKIISAPFRVF